MITFDCSLPRFVLLVVKSWGPEALVSNFFLRDVSGKLTFIVRDSQISKVARIQLAGAASAEMGNYVDGDGFSVATPEELFDERLSGDDGLRSITISLDSNVYIVKLLDRRMIGGDWLRNPTPDQVSPPRLAFTSIKGGVGRSTALCVLASHLSASGKRILAIDMDIEAPGLGNMLLPADTLPEFGLLDYLVEVSLGAVDDRFFVDMVGSSWIGGGIGRVDVIPALGARALANPANVLAKIARAYLATEDGETVVSFTDHIRALLERVGTVQDYDLVLIDSRAGLHETTAASFTGLGAHILLFGVDQPQTFHGFKLLFSHLSLLDEGDTPWLDRITLVNAKASRRSKGSNEFYERAMEVAADSALAEIPARLDSLEGDLQGLSEEFEVKWDEERENLLAELPVDFGDELDVVSIYDDPAFRYFDPESRRDILEPSSYKSAYSDFIELVSDIVFSQGNAA